MFATLTLPMLFQRRHRKDTGLTGRSLHLLLITLLSSISYAFMNTNGVVHRRNAALIRNYIHRLCALPSPPSSSEATAHQPQNLTTTAKFSGGSVSFTLHSSISEISPEAWDSCLMCRKEKSGKDVSQSPFLEHAWLRCLEESGCASSKTGWTPQHLSVQISGNSQKNYANQGESTPDGFVPVYIKNHSMGEFIFDNAWADAAYRNGLEYYPKVLVGVPFTPVTGSRLLWQPWVWRNFSKDQIKELCTAVGNFLKQVAIHKGCSSVHINFCTEEEADILSGPLKLQEKSEAGSRPTANPMTKPFQAMLRQIRYKNTDNFLRRTSLQYHWKNTNPKRQGQPYVNFEEYLSCFRSKRRIAIRRERAKVREDSNIRVDVVRGKDILKVDGLVERMFGIYVSTVDRVFWGRQYLTSDFFHRLSKSSFVENLCFLCARYNTGKGNGDGKSHGSQKENFPVIAEDVIAGTFNVIKDGVFYGRYWGCLPEYETGNLHFETCYWSAIEYCIDNSLKRMEPGAGGAGKPNLP